MPGSQVPAIEHARGLLAPAARRLHFGLGAALQAERVEIRWPSGLDEAVTAVRANQVLHFEEGRGLTRQEPFRR